MSRFRVIRENGRIEVIFDDGAMNLLSADALRELRRVLEDDAIPSSAARLLIFRSGRHALFAAGADMAEMREFTPAEAAEFSRLGQELFGAIERLPCLTTILIDGDCFGGALDLALAFDVRYATPRSRFSHPGARLGITTGFGGTTRWRKVLTRPAANVLFIDNRIVDAAEAEALGLLDGVTSELERVADALDSADPRLVRLAKELSGKASSLSRPQLLLLARRLGHLYFG